MKALVTKFGLFAFGLFALTSFSASATVMGAGNGLNSDPNITLKTFSSETGVSNVPQGESGAILTSNASYFNPADNAFNAPPFSSAEVLEVDFANPVRAFSVTSTTSTDVGLMFFLYDDQDNFVRQFYDLSTYSPAPTAFNGGVFEPNRHAFFTFDFDVGKIILGGAADPHVITSIASISVPEPGAAGLMCLGLLAMVGNRKFRL